MTARVRSPVRQESWETGISEDSSYPRSRDRDRDRHRNRRRQASEETYDTLREREERRRRRRRDRQASEASTQGDDQRRRNRDRNRDRPRERERYGRDSRDVRDARDPASRRDRTRKPDRQLTQETFLTPDPYDLSGTINTAYSPFSDPMGLGLSSSPPAYEYNQSPIRTAKAMDGGLWVTTDPELGGRSYDDILGLGDGGGKEGDGVGGKVKNRENSDKEVPKLERWLGPLVYILPVLTAIALLFAATCSADEWRVKVNVLRVNLPDDVFARLLATGKNLGKSGTGDTAKSGGSGEKSTGSGRTLESRAGKVVAAGYLSVGFWGWCVSRIDHSEYACSPTNAWYTMEDLLETAEVTSSIPSRAFHDGLIHGLVVYGPAMVAAMVAAVPAGIHIYRRLIKNNRVIEAGIVLHASLFCGGTFSFIAFMVSKALEMRLDKKIKFQVVPGLLPTMAGVASLLLFLSLGASSVPVIYRRVKRQRDILGSWDDVQAAQPTPLPSLTPSPMQTSLGRSFSLKRNKTWKRMTGYWGSKSKSRSKERGRRDRRDRDKESRGRRRRR